ncbi:DUF5127 domain-containing protein [Haladaptatus sp. DFWS20]|uniref:DUF5127 domain-containing protein n=1 Tax=Haladaptatus sp. DFWS20 TaxID=3403467 RepID=UPI003EBD1238
MKTLKTQFTPSTRLEVEFISPLLLEEFEILARPATYVSFCTRSIDSRSHDISIYLALSS